MSRRATSNHGPARPGRSGPWPSSEPARWACPSSPSSPPTAGVSSPSTSTPRSSTRSTTDDHISMSEPGLAEPRHRRAHGGPPAGDTRRNGCGSRGGCRGPDRPRDARRGVETGSPVDGRGRRLDRCRPARRLDRHLRDDPPGRRHAGPVWSPAGRGVGAHAGAGSVRRVLTRTPVQRCSPAQPGHLPETRRRVGRRVDGSCGRVL